MRIQLLSFSGCPAAPIAREALAAALRSLALSAAVEEVDLESLPWRGARRGWGSPTILVDGRDLMGRAAPTCSGVGARFYPGGLPSTGELASRLSALRSAGPTAA